MGFIINTIKGNIIPISKYDLEEKHMDYKKAYTLLAGTMSDAMDEIEKSRVISQEMENAIKMLKDGLDKVEEMYLCAEERTDA